MKYDLDAYARANGQVRVQLSGEGYVLRQFSVRQVAALLAANADLTDEESFNEMVPLLAGRLTHEETGDPIDPAVLWELDSETFGFLSDLLFTEKAMRRNGTSAEKIRQVMDERKPFLVEAQAA
jgi:hypothetical protein